MSEEKPQTKTMAVHYNRVEISWVNKAEPLTLNDVVVVMPTWFAFIKVEDGSVFQVNPDAVQAIHKHPSGKDYWYDYNDGKVGEGKIEVNNDPNPDLN